MTYQYVLLSMYCLFHHIDEHIASFSEFFFVKRFQAIRSCNKGFWCVFEKKLLCFSFFCAFDKSCITFFSSSNREKVHTYTIQASSREYLGSYLDFVFFLLFFCVRERKLYSFDLLINELCIYSKPNHMNEKYKPLLQILHVNSLCIRQLNTSLNGKNGAV